METLKFYSDKFYTKFYYNYVVWKLAIVDISVIVIF